MRTLTVQGQGGVGTFKTPENWQAMAPVQKVLMIHSACRDITKGKPFDIVLT